MCTQDSNRTPDPLLQIIEPPAVFTIEPAERGSRRRRLWELDTHAHCPVIGVCMPIGALRKLADKVLGGQALADDYELHCGAVAECRSRTRMSEALHKALERRYALTIRDAGRIKDAANLAEWWRQAAAGKDLAGALWAVLTHPQCNSVLEHQVLGEVHMLQHQVGAAARADLTRFQALLDENAVLARALGEAQQRNTRQAATYTQESDRLRAEIMQLRAELVRRDTTEARLREALQTLESTMPDLAPRNELLQANRRLESRLLAVQRELALAREQVERLQRRAARAAAAVREQIAANEPRQEDQDPGFGGAAAEAPRIPALRDRAVLCVGGRPASVPAYRRLIEHTGGRFLHHDGGEEESDARLESTLAAADLVICQTGCISHNAYWRVKDHCKRTGKRCVFVDTPSRAGLERALREIGSGAQAEPEAASAQLVRD